VFTGPTLPARGGWAAICQASRLREQAEIRQAAAGEAYGRRSADLDSAAVPAAEAERPLRPLHSPGPDPMASLEFPAAEEAADSDTPDRLDNHPGSRPGPNIPVPGNIRWGRRPSRRRGYKSIRSNRRCRPRPSTPGRNGSKSCSTAWCSGIVDSASAAGSRRIVRRDRRAARPFGRWSLSAGAGIPPAGTGRPRTRLQDTTLRAWFVLRGSESNVWHFLRPAATCDRDAAQPEAANGGPT
jgi:hypothetical protein